MLRALYDGSLKPDVFVDIADEFVAWPHPNVPCGNYVTPNENVDVEEECDIWGPITKSKVFDKVVQEIYADVKRATGTNDEWLPPPLVVLLTELHIGRNDRQERDHNDLSDHIEEKETEHGIHFRLKPALEHVM